LAKIEAMSFYIRVSSLITPLHRITQTEEPEKQYCNNDKKVIAFLFVTKKVIIGFRVVSRRGRAIAF
jgi:hypothetical protein